ncbi:MAG: hypothetical protein U9N49_07185 [Campylobacterota bacterium]|nr:hypothetical protein [Campylobacterota bacterium]
MFSQTIEKDEFLPLTMLFMHSFLSGIALIFFETTANTIFLVDLGVSHLPYVYILSAIVSIVAGYSYTLFEERLDIKMLLKIMLGFVLFIVTSFVILIQISNHPFISLALMVFKDLIWIFVSMEFGLLIGIILNIRQGKRLFGILMSGEILAGIIGGLSVGFILNFIDTKHLLVISIIALLFSMLLLVQIIDKFSERFDQIPPKAHQEGSLVSTHKILSNNYYLLFFALSALACLIFYFIDYIFYHSIEQQYQSPKELASFFGLFFALLNIINLLSSLFISGRMLSHFGVIFGLLVMPMIALFGSSFLLLISVASLGIGFVVVVGIKVLIEVSDLSILNPTFKTLYQSIPIKYRPKVMAYKESIIEPLAMGVAGLMLLGLTALATLQTLYIVIILLALVWLFLSKAIKKHYLNALEAMLFRREALEDDIHLDSMAQKLFMEHLKSDDEMEVIYSLDSLIKMQYEDIDALMLKLIDHPSKRVRLYLLDLIRILQ